MPVSMSHWSASNEKCPSDKRLRGISRGLNADYLHSLPEPVFFRPFAERWRHTFPAHHAVIDVSAVQARALRGLHAG